MISTKQPRRTGTQGFATPRHRMGFSGNLLAAGLVLALIGLLAMVTIPDHPAALRKPGSLAHTASSRVTTAPFSPPPETTLNPCPGPRQQPGTSCAAAGSPPQTVTVTRPATTTVAGRTRGAHTDSREFLQDAAAALRTPGVRPQNRETRTDLWINAPGIVGNSSPPEASPLSPPTAR